MQYRAMTLRNVYSELYSQTNIINSNKNLEIRLHIFCLFVLNILISLISLTVAHTPERHKELNNSLWVTRHTLNVPSALLSGWCVRMEWILAYPLGVKVTTSHAYKTIPWYLLKLTSKYLINTPITFIEEHSHHPRNEDSDLFHWIHFPGKTISIDWFTTVWSLLVSSW